MQQILSGDTELVSATCGKYTAVYCGLIATGAILSCGDGKILHTAGKGVVRMHVLRGDEHSSLAV